MRGSWTRRRRSMGAGRSLLKSPLATWQRQMGAPLTIDLNPSQHAPAGARTSTSVRKSAQGISPDTDV